MMVINPIKLRIPPIKKGETLIERKEQKTDVKYGIYSIQNCLRTEFAAKANRGFERTSNYRSRISSHERGNKSKKHSQKTKYELLQSAGKDN